MAGHDEPSRRAAERAAWPVRRYPLGGEPPGDPTGETSAEERIAMMWPLAREAWELAGLAIPDYSRADVPCRFFRDGRGR